MNNSSASKAVAFPGTCWEVRSLRRCQRRLPARAGCGAGWVPASACALRGSHARGPRHLRAGGAPSPSPEQSRNSQCFPVTSHLIDFSQHSLSVQLEGEQGSPARCVRALCSSIPPPRSGERVGSPGAQPSFGARRPAPCAGVATSTRICRKPNSASGNMQLILNEFSPTSPPNHAAGCLVNKITCGF